jgi:hypothetical protein
MTVRANISLADALFAGRGGDQQVKRANAGYFGVPVHLVSKFSLGTPAVADADFLVNAATGNELPNNETVTYTTATDGTTPLDTAAPAPSTITLPDRVSTASVWALDVPRNLVAVVTHQTAVVAMTVTVHGYDQYYRAMSELFTVTAGDASKTVTGKKAFAYVKSIVLTAAGNAEANTLNLGTGSKLGLPYLLTAVGDVLAASLGGVQELVNVSSNATLVVGDATSPATTATGDVRGTCTFNGTLNDTAEAVVWMHVQNPNTAAGLAGVAQV